MGPNAAVAIEESIFWMGEGSFYTYQGGTKALPCTVKEQVFFDFNYNQKDKVYAAHNSEFTEITWFYCSDTNSFASGGDGQNNKYVTYNYGEGVWYYGTLSRTAFMDRGVNQYPIGAQDGYLYNHEVGYDDDGSAMTASLESSPMDVGEGERMVFINRIIPDFTFQGSSTSGSAPAVNMTLSMQDYPGSSYGQAETDTVTSSAISTTTVPFEQFTTKADIRLRGRSFAMKVSSTGAGVRWRLGSPRINLRADGRR